MKRGLKAHDLQSGGLCLLIPLDCGFWELAVGQCRGVRALGAAGEARQSPSSWHCHQQEQSNHPAPKLPDLALEVLHPGKLLSPKETGTAGHPTTYKATQNRNRKRTFKLLKTSSSRRLIHYYYQVPSL